MEADPDSKRKLMRDCSENSCMSVLQGRAQEILLCRTLGLCGVQGENAWISVNEEEVASATKAYVAFEKELKEAVPREQRAAFKPCEITGAVVDGKPLDLVSKTCRCSQGTCDGCVRRQGSGLHGAGCPCCCLCLPSWLGAEALPCCGQCLTC